MKGYRRAGLGWLSRDGLAYLESGAPNDDDAREFCWIIWFRLSPGEYDEDRYGAFGTGRRGGPTAHDPVRTLAQLTGEPSAEQAWFGHLADAIGLGDARATAASIIADRAALVRYPAGIVLTDPEGNVEHYRDPDEALAAVRAGYSSATTVKAQPDRSIVVMFLEQTIVYSWRPTWGHCPECETVFELTVPDDFTCPVCKPLNPNRGTLIPAGASR